MFFCSLGLVEISWKIKPRGTVVATERKNKEFFMEPAHHVAAREATVGFIGSRSRDIRGLGTSHFVIPHPVAPVFATQEFLKEPVLFLQLHREGCVYLRSIKVTGRRVCFKPECDAIIGLLRGPFCALEVGL